MMRFLPLFLLLGCATTRIATLEKRIDTLERVIYGPSEAEQRAAYTLYTEALTLIGDAPDPTSPNLEAARVKLRTIVADYADTQAGEAATDLLSDLDIIGKHIGQITGTTGLQGEGVISAAPVTLLAFWEAWCPHCQREVPKLSAWVDQFGGQGFQVISLTRMSRDTSEAQVMDFAQSNNVTFPIGHEDGTMSSLFGVSGIPAAAAVRDGVVIWRGHPGELSAAVIESWLSKPKNP